MLITRGEQGRWLSSDEIDGGIPAVAREVSDVTGAGDTVVAVLALAVAARATLQEAAILANHAAGIVVCLVGFAFLACNEERWAAAARLFGAADTLRDAIGVPLHTAYQTDRERHLEAARLALGAAQFDAAYEEGRRLPLDRVVAVMTDRIEPATPA